MKRNFSQGSPDDQRLDANGQPIADSSTGNPGHLSSSNAAGSTDNPGEPPTPAPDTQPATSAVPKQKVDRSQFISQSKPVSAPSGTKQTKFPLRKPGGKLFFWATTDPNACMLADIIEGNMGKAWVVGAGVIRTPALERFISQAMLVPCINERGQIFVWFIKTTSREWCESALEMVEEAKKRPIRIEADAFAQSYRFEDASAFPELAAAKPNWSVSPSEVLDEVLSSSAITRDNDPVLNDILGKRRGRGNS